MQTILSTFTKYITVGLTVFLAAYLVIGHTASMYTIGMISAVTIGLFMIFDLNCAMGYIGSSSSNRST